MTRALARNVPPRIVRVRCWRVNSGLEINVEAGMEPATVEALLQRGHQVVVIDEAAC